MSNKSVNIGVGLDTNEIATGIQQMVGQLRSLVGEISKIQQPAKAANAEVAKMGETFKKSNQNSGLAGAAVMEFSRAMSDLPFGIRGVANNIGQLSTLFATLSVNAGGVRGALSEMRKQMMGPLGVVVAIQTLMALMQSDWFSTFISRIANMLPFMDKIRDAFNRAKLAIQGFLDSTGLTNFALSKDVEKFESYKISIEQTIRELEALGNQEHKIMSLKRGLAKMELDLLARQSKDRGSATDKEVERFNQIRHELKLSEIAYAKFLNSTKKGTFEKIEMKPKLDLTSFSNYLETELAKSSSKARDLKPLEVSMPVKIVINNWEQMRMQLNDMINRFAIDTSAAFLGAIGESIGGGKDAIKQFGQDFLGEFGGFLQQVGAMILTYGFAMEAFKNAFKNPITTIAAGAALIVIGGAIKGAHEKKFGKSAGGSGGVSGGYGGGSGSYNSQLQDNIIYSRLDGRDLVLSNQRTGYSNGR